METGTSPGASEDIIRKITTFFHLVFARAEDTLPAGMNGAAAMERRKFERYDLAIPVRVEIAEGLTRNY